MGIFIRNAETERKARELAALDGTTLTGAVDAALDAALADRKANQSPRRTLESMLAATARMHAATGYKPGSHPPVTKEEWDELNAIGYPEFDDA